MRSQNLTIEEKVDRLNEQLEGLNRRVADLEGRRSTRRRFPRTPESRRARPPPGSPAASPTR
jgi:hypothetical protein